jgi:hypothetical protein
MANRRQVIAAGLALSALPGIGTGRAAATPLRFAPMSLARLVVDMRFADAVAMASQPANAGVSTVALERDVLGLWHDALLPALAGDAAAAVGGITTDTALFLIRTLAADQRLRVVYRADHHSPAADVLRHVLAGPANTVSRIAAMPATGDWRSRFGQALVSMDAAGRPMRRTVVTAGDPRQRRAETLVSWVIAPPGT